MGNAGKWVHSVMKNILGNCSAFLGERPFLEAFDKKIQQSLEVWRSYVR